ncbi:MAG: hypothetical protein LBV72_04765 [Tannerella sp.]|nr:hypothetical protein [Tannerella sp.]
MKFIKDKSNRLLVLILGVLLLILVYKEFEYHRFQRYIWNIGVISSTDVTTEIFSYKAFSEKEKYYDWGAYYYGDVPDIIYKVKSEEERLYYPWRNRDERKIFPEKAELHWAILEEDSEWKLHVDLPRKYLEGIQKKSAPSPFQELDFVIIAQMHPGGKVTLLLYADNQITPLGTWQGEQLNENAAYSISDTSMVVYHWFFAATCAKKDCNSALSQ